MSARSANTFTRKKGEGMPDFSLFKTHVVAVGIPDDVVHNPSNLIMSELAAIHEFGSSDGRIPARPAIRNFAKESRQQAKKMLTNAAKNVMNGASAAVEMDKVALWAQGQLQLSYEKISTPPLADSTLGRKKGKAKTTAADESSLAAQGKETLNNPLIDTGELVGSVIGQVQKND